MKNLATGPRDCQGDPKGVRLTADAKNPVYWGKDGAIFMEEVLAWLPR